jgi:hypothetical protein
MKRVARLHCGIQPCLARFRTMEDRIGSPGNLTPATIDPPREGPPGVARREILAPVARVGLPQAIVERPPFRRRFTRRIPDAVERATLGPATCTPFGVRRGERDLAASPPEYEPHRRRVPRFTPGLGESQGADARALPRAA